MSDRLDIKARWDGRPGLRIDCGAEIANGWNGVLSDALDRIARAVERSRSGIRIVQIKEKFGELRIYYDDLGLSRRESRSVDAIINLAEARSRRTCEDCAAPGVLRARRGWMNVACDAHSNDPPAGLFPGAGEVWTRGASASRKSRIEERVRYDADLDRIVVLSRRKLRRARMKPSKGWF